MLRVLRTSPIIIVIFIISAIIGYMGYDGEGFVRKKYLELSTSGVMKPGYPSTKSMETVNSLEEMENKKYFTMAVDKKDLEITDYYFSADMKTSGQISSKVERYLFYRWETTHHVRVCVLTLKGGKKLLAVIDTNALNLDRERIYLPIGELVHYKKVRGTFRRAARDYGVEDEKTVILMTSSKWANEVNPIWLKDQRSSAMTRNFLLTFIISMILFVGVAYVFVPDKEVEKTEEK